MKTSVFDLNLSRSCGHSFPSLGEDGTDESGQNGFCAADGFHSCARVPGLRRALSRQLQGQQFFLLGPISLHGLCSTDLPRKFARYRNLSSRHGRTTVSSGHSRTCCAQHLGRCQRGTELAHLCRFGSDLDWQCSPTVCPGKFRSGIATDGLRSGLHYHRSLSGAVSVGALPHQKRRSQNAHSARFAWQHTCLHQRCTRENPRDSRSRPTAGGTRLHLSSGSSLLGFPATVYSQTGSGFLHHSGPQKLLLPTRLLPSGGQAHGTSFRSNDLFKKLLPSQVLPRNTTPHSLSRRRYPEKLGLSDQQLSVAQPCHSSTLQMSVASRTVFQMDQTTSAHQEVLWHFSQRREDANLDRHLRLRAAVDCPQAIGTETQPLPDFTNSQSDFVRESAAFTGVFAILLARPNINFL